MKYVTLKTEDTAEYDIEMEYMKVGKKVFVE